MKLQEQKNGQKMITIPAQIARAKGWKKGDKLKWRVGEDGKLILEKD
ncbi:MAG: AbrB family looped-hinge helix DNA binding protein [Candidatus Nanohaloarchaea archaeon]|jgi:AbrB family looped-hinge helix DNA binding protein